MSKSNIITTATDEDMKSAGISHDKIRLDKLRGDLNSLRVPMKVPGRGVIERKFNDGKLNYSIDENDNTIHFLGGCLGPECNTLRQPDKAIMHRARVYLGTFTFDAGRNPHLAGRGLKDDESYDF